MNSKENQIRNDMFVKHAKLQMENLNITLDNISDEMVLKCLDVIYSASKIYMAGCRSSYTVIHYLFSNLDRILRNCELLSQSTWDLPERVQKIGPSDVIFVISMPRYIKQIVDIAKIGKQKGAKVIAITDGYLSPVVDFSDIVFTASNKSFDFHNSLIGALYVADLLITAVALKDSILTKKRLGEAEDIIREWHLYTDLNKYK